VKYVVNDHVVLSRAPEGPLAPHIGSFSQWVIDHGYTIDAVQKQTRIAAFFSHWLGQQAVRLRDLSMQHATRFLRHRARRRRPYLGDPAALRRLLDFLPRQRLIPGRKRVPVSLTPAERCVHAYERYLRETRALANATITNYAPFIQEFLTHRFGNGPISLARLTARDVVRLVQRQAPRLYRKRAQLLTSALRSFFQYARYRGGVTRDLAAAVPAVANWSMPSIPRAIGDEQIRQLLASINRRTAMGRRDYAIVLLLARLGLRANEVAGLELDDLNWEMGQVSVRGKRGHRTVLPLPADVGAAIAAYLRHGRPLNASRRVFLRSKAPIQGFVGQCAIGSIIRHRLHRAGITAPTTGAHQFRHALATRMLRRGASLTEIGEILRHRSPQTTMVYAKVDLPALRTLALPWPGGVR
jgi:site-specific recombinase XerD